MAEMGFSPLPKEMIASRTPTSLVWHRSSDGVLVYDTKPSNFVKTGEGVIEPIDLVVSLYPCASLEETAALNGVAWPERGG